MKLYWGKKKNQSNCEQFYHADREAALHEHPPHLLSAAVIEAHLLAHWPVNKVAVRVWPDPIPWLPVQHPAAPPLCLNHPCNIFQFFSTSPPHSESAALHHALNPAIGFWIIHWGLGLSKPNRGSVFHLQHLNWWTQTEWSFNCMCGNCGNTCGLGIWCRWG